MPVLALTKMTRHLVLAARVTLACMLWHAQDYWHHIQGSLVVQVVQDSATYECFKDNSLSVAL